MYFFILSVFCLVLSSPISMYDREHIVYNISTQGYFDQDSDPHTGHTRFTVSAHFKSMFVY